MSIQRRAPGRYEVTVELGFDPVSGKRKRVYQSVKGPKKEAERVERDLLSMRDRGTAIASSNITLARYLLHWLEQYAETSVTSSTLARYRSAVVKHLIPHVGHVKLDELRPTHIQELDRVCLREGLAQATVRQHHRILSRALRLAVQWQLLGSNPAAAINAPRVDRQEIAALNVAEAQALLRTADTDPLFPFVFLALMTGARNGELCGLRWSDIDLENRRLSIRRTAQRLAGKGVQMLPTKTHRSRRAIALSPDTVAFLKSLRESQDARLGPMAEAHERLVLPQANGSPHEPRQVSVGFRRIRALAGLPSGLRFHDLRHASATMQLAAGIHPKVLIFRFVRPGATRRNTCCYRGVSLLGRCPGTWQLSRITVIRQAGRGRDQRNLPVGGSREFSTSGP